MKKLALASSAAALALVCAPAFADHHESAVLGSWTVTTETQRGTREMTLTFTFEDGAYAVDIVQAPPAGGPGGGAGGGFGGAGGAPEMTISDLEVTENSFSFTRTISFNGNEFALSYAGEVDGDTLTGTQTSQLGESELTGSRAAE